jgi:hypothetical protein
VLRSRKRICLRLIDTTYALCYLAVRWRLPRFRRSASPYGGASGVFYSGPLAQLAEQVTLNHPVPGSIPGRLTSSFIEEGYSSADSPNVAAKGEVSELADEHDLGSCAARRRSSSLLFPTSRQIWHAFSRDRYGAEDTRSSDAPRWTKGE